jgi:signal transduction histidine kinase/ActR/RegA family two-component response regulator
MAGMDTVDGDADLDRRRRTSEATRRRGLRRLMILAAVVLLGGLGALVGALAAALHAGARWWLVAAASAGAVVASLALRRMTAPLRWLVGDLTARDRQLLAQEEALRAQGDEVERQRRELIEQSRRSQAADGRKSAFIANMSHEIRTPLNSVLALSQLLRDGMAGPISDDQRNYLEVIERNGQNLLRLINDVLDLSRIEAGHLPVDLQTLDLGGQIRAAVGGLAPLAEAKGLALQARLPERPALARGDADRVRQILTNLVGNAIKFTEAGRVTVSTEARGDAVAIHVTDTGVGIPPALQARVFEEFFQIGEPPAAGRPGGTGLGLAIASRLARLMDGAITVESAAGQGSRFTLTLPRGAVAAADGPAEGAAVAVAPPPSASHRPRPVEAAELRRPLVPPAGGLAPAPDASILIVEDDEDNLFTLRQILSGLASELVAVGNGQEAVEYCSRRPPDVILTDGQMGSASGRTMAAAIRSLPGGAAIPIIALTAHAMTGDRERILAAGCDEYLAKPVQPKALLAVVERCLRRRADAAGAGGGGGPRPSGEEEHGTHTAGR